MRKYAILSVLMLVLFAVPVLAINNQPVSKPVIKPDKIFECEGQPVLDGSSSYDLDGNYLTFNWYREGNLFAEGKIAKIGPDIANHSGAYPFTLKATDGGGSSDSKDAMLTVVSNPMPHIDNLKYTLISGNGIKERIFLINGDMIQLEAVKGKSSRIKNYEWKYDEKVFQKIGNGSVVRFKVISDSFQSNQEIKVIAFNACGVESNIMGKNLVMRSVSQNTPPTSSIGLPPIVYEGKTFTIYSSNSKTGQGFNEQGDKIVQWRWEIRISSGSVIFRSKYQNPEVRIEDSGMFSAHLWVTDSFGAVGYSNTSFWVTDMENDLSIADASATEKIAIHGKNITLNASRSWDPDGRAEDAIKRYEWHDMTYDPKNGDKICSSQGPTCIVVFNRTGIHNIRLKVFDAGILGEGIISDIKINVIPFAENDQASVSLPSKTIASQEGGKTGRQENVIDPEEILRKSSDQQEQNVPADAKPAPGMEGIIAIIAIAVIAKKFKN
jgi:hypothetical protein